MVLMRHYDVYTDLYFETHRFLKFVFHFKFITKILISVNSIDETIWCLHIYSSIFCIHKLLKSAFHFKIFESFAKYFENK